MSTAAPRLVSFGIWGPILREDLPGLCDRVCALFAAEAPTVAVCDVSTVPADAVCVDALARLQLAAKRTGCVVRLRDASPELREIVGFMGLTAVLLER